jgi:hypothetical protein
MNYIAWLGLGVIALFAAAAWIAIWSRRDTWGRHAAVLVFIIGLPAIAAAGVESLGWHRPLKLSWDLEPGDHRVLAVKMVQDRAIYIYLDDGQREEPRPIVMPWSNQAANRIQGLIEEGGPEANGQFMMRYEPSLDVAEQQFHPLPQPPALPPKDPPNQMLRFDQGV